MTKIFVLTSRPTRGLFALMLLGGFGLGLIAYRFIFGLGAVTNLSDGYPWGFWIGIDVLVGIALAAGGFVMAGLVHIFGGHRFHTLVRPAILTALLGYLLFIFALAVDLGRPWHIWVTLFSWNHVSPMFEVAWCVMLYTFVLFLEFAPPVLERLRLERVLHAWREVSPWLVVAALSLFVFAMTNSLAWFGITCALLLTWETLMRADIMPRDKQMPLLLILAGIMLSTMHQSSLGTLFLIIDKLSPLWYTPILPGLFLVSAVMVGPAMVILESTSSSRVLGHETEIPLLASLGKAMPSLIGVYLTLRLADIIVRGIVWETVAPSLQGLWWWLEIGLLLLAMICFMAPEVRSRRRGLLIASLATIAALVVHRSGVAMIGLTVPEYGAYRPAWSEVAITAGIISLGLVAFRLAVAYLPIYAEQTQSRPASESKRRATPQLSATRPAAAAR
jgi:Ni/Fe-hydrogenase subunit HybB-like protein